MSRRAFALPLVVAFIVVFAILVMAMVNRQSAQRLLAQRGLDSYSDHHIAKGLQEGVQAWISISSAQGIAQALGSDGHAFDLEPEGGRPVRIRFEEAQDTLLSDFAGLSAQETELAALALSALEREVGADEARQLIRTEGPLAVGVRTARPEVLRAILSATLDDDAAAELAKKLGELRNDPELSQQRLTEIVNVTQATAEQRMAVMLLLTAEPTLWRVTAESESSNGPPIRYEGLALVPTASQRRTAAGITRMSSILSWRRAQ